MNNKLTIGLGVLAILVLLYMININQQNSYKSTSEKLLNINKEKINKILIQSKSEAIELLKIDTTWVISGHDSLQIKTDVLGSLFDKDDDEEDIPLNTPHNGFIPDISLSVICKTCIIHSQSIQTESLSDPYDARHKLSEFEMNDIINTQQRLNANKSV